MLTKDLLLGKYRHKKTSKQYEVFIVAENLSLPITENRMMAVYGRAQQYYARRIDEFGEKFVYLALERTPITNIPSQVINATNANDGQKLNLFLLDGLFYLRIVK